MHRKIILKDDNLRIQMLIILLADIIALVLSIMLANYIRLGDPFYAGVPTSEFRWAFLTLLLAYVVLYLTDNSHGGFFRRGDFHELIVIIKRNAWIFLLGLIVMFVFQVTDDFSRIIIVLTWGFSVFWMWVFRTVVKKILHKIYEKQEHRSYLVVLTVYHQAHEVLYQLRAGDAMLNYHINGLILVDQPACEKIGNVDGVPVIGHRNFMYDCVLASAVDEIFISIPPTDNIALNLSLDKMVKKYESLGLVVNVNIQLPGLNLRNHRSTVRYFNGYNTVSFAKSVQGLRMVMIKRMMDVFLSMVGLLFSAVVILLVAPFLLIESPGPLFFSQIRIGKNGRKFKLYKIRSMYPDAEARKKELMEKNEMDGLMFKIKDDPRVTKVGAFIRRTSMDELPQLWNVLKGDMSLVGTRPPTEDEYIQYELPYKRRLSIRPGITGMWQVSGRSNITKFEDVLALDLEYIDKWSLYLELKILLKTVLVVFGKVGAR
ncbi:MAG: sugar transferase [Lachnospiraceae bacterium]|nr:sugar transferase [Lachnospiraceae bacterium]